QDIFERFARNFPGVNVKELPHTHADLIRYPLTGARQKQPVRLVLQKQRDAGQLLWGDVLQPCGDVFDEPGRNLVSQIGVPSLPGCQRPSPPFFQFSKAWALSPTAAS